MYNFKVGDIVGRKSYNDDTLFRIEDIRKKDSGKPVYVLRGLLIRLQADADGEDLVRHDSREADMRMRKDVTSIKRHVTRNRGYISPDMKLLPRLRYRTGVIMHIDSSKSLMNMCIKEYREEGLRFVAKLADEKDQPALIRPLLERYKPDILVVTGHDAMKKDGKINSLDSYRNSKYFLQSVREARRYESSKDKLFIFAGACQSYYEALMDAGANFASSPGRILINGLDPAIVAEKAATTDSKLYFTPEQVAQLTLTGREGIWGIRSRGYAN